MRRAFTGTVLVLTATGLAGCGGPADLPDDAAFRDCLDAVGVDADELDSTESRQEAFAEPEPMDCVVTELDPAQQRDVLSEVFGTPELAEAIAGWVAYTDLEGEDAVRAAGTLAGAAGDPEDFEVTGGLLDENVAWAIYTKDEGEPASYQRWLDDPEAQDAVSESDPLSGPSLYLDWLEEQGTDSEEYATAEEIRALQSGVADARESAAE